MILISNEELEIVYRNLIQVNHFCLEAKKEEEEEKKEVIRFCKNLLLLMKREKCLRVISHNSTVYCPWLMQTCISLDGWTV